MAEGVSPHGFVTIIMVFFVIALLGAALTSVFDTQITNWAANLTADGQTSAATVVNLIPTIFWILVGVGLILMAVGVFMGRGRGL